MPDLDIYIDVAASLEVMAHQGMLISEVPAAKGLEDLRRYSRVLEETRPDLIIQTGTAVGGSALWFAFGADVITIDIDGDRVHPLVHASERITVLTGSSTHPSIIAAVKAKAAAYAKTMVVLDSDHSAAHVAAEIAAYGSLVSPGCYLVVEDGIWDFEVDGPFNPGPLHAIKACIVGDPAWERDIEIEATEPISMYPGGWWIKK